MMHSRCTEFAGQSAVEAHAEDARNGADRGQRAV